MADPVAPFGALLALAGIAAEAEKVHRDAYADGRYCRTVPGFCCFVGEQISHHKFARWLVESVHSDH
jgi:hypothetical protein